MKKVVWGMLGTAKIGRQRVIPGMQKSKWCEIRAIASRSAQSARAAAGALGIPKAYGSYEELLADPDIEAVYNPLPNHLHVPLTLRAAAAGKHVLQMLFSYFNVDAGNIRNIAAIGGGALYDIGCYPITAGRFFFESEPQRAIALVDRDPGFGTDRMTSALLDFGSGRHLDFTVSTQCAPYQRVQLCGSKGRIEIQIPVNAPQGEKTSIFLDDGSSLAGAGIRTETLPESDQYTLQGEAFSRAIRGEIALPYGVEDAVQSMRVIDALFRSEKSGRWEKVQG